MEPGGSGLSLPHPGAPACPGWKTKLDRIWCVDLSRLPRAEGSPLQAFPDQSGTTVTLILYPPCLQRVYDSQCPPALGLQLPKGMCYRPAIAQSVYSSTLFVPEPQGCLFLCTCDRLEPGPQAPSDFLLLLHFLFSGVLLCLIVLFLDYLFACKIFFFETKTMF